MKIKFNKIVYKYNLNKMYMHIKFVMFKFWWSSWFIDFIKFCFWGSELVFTNGELIIFKSYFDATVCAKRENGFEFSIFWVNN